MVFPKVLNILNFANVTVIETDGPYPGYTCSSTNHSHHSDQSDSVYRQNMLQGNFYNILRQKGMYINQPDNYFFQGANKAGKRSFINDSMQNLDFFGQSTVILKCPMS